MLLLTEDELEFPTPLSADTHGLSGVYMWLVLNSDLVFFTKTYESESMRHPNLVIKRNTLEVIKMDVFSREESKKYIRLISANKQLIEQYVNCEIAAKELLNGFVRI